MAVDRHNLWSSLDFLLCGKQPIPVSPELRLYAYKSCLSDYTHTHTLTPFSLHIYCSIVCFVTHTYCIQRERLPGLALCSLICHHAENDERMYTLTDKLTLPPTVTVTTWKTKVTAARMMLQQSHKHEQKSEHIFSIAPVSFIYMLVFSGLLWCVVCILCVWLRERDLSPGSWRVQIASDRALLLSANTSLRQLRICVSELTRRNTTFTPTDREKEGWPHTSQWTWMSSWWL